MALSGPTRWRCLGQQLTLSGRRTALLAAFKPIDLSEVLSARITRAATGKDSDGLLQPE